MMADKSKIEWTDATWNPVTGCTPVSDGCTNCYAARMVKRFPDTHGYQDHSNPQYLMERRPFSKVAFHHYRLDQPLHWKKPRRIFVCSMGDLFHEDVKSNWIGEIWHMMARCPQHTFMILTKRPEKMSAFAYASSSVVGPYGHNLIPLPNLWLGVTAENQEMADQRIPILLQTPAAKRFVSIEPCLGPVDLNRSCSSLLDTVFMGHDWQKPVPYPCSKLSWVVCGGESGPGARPMHPDWPRTLRDQCQASGVPFFFKQWGEWKWDLREYGPDGEPWSHKNEWFRTRVGKKSAGCLLNGKEWKQFPEVNK